MPLPLGETRQMISVHEVVSFQALLTFEAMSRRHFDLRQLKEAAFITNFQAKQCLSAVEDSAALRQLLVT